MDDQVTQSNVVALVDQYQASGDPGVALQLKKAISRLPSKDKAAFRDYIKNIDQNKKEPGGNMGEDNGQVNQQANQTNTQAAPQGGAIAATMDDKLGKIEERLKQIASYRFVPPSIKREREELEKQKAAILQNRTGNPGTSPDTIGGGTGQAVEGGTGESSPPPATAPAGGDQGGGATPQSASQITDFWSNSKSGTGNAESGTEEKEKKPIFPFLGNRTEQNKDAAVQNAIATPPVGTQSTQSQSSASDTGDQNESHSAEASRDKQDDWFNISTANASGEDGDQDVPAMNLDEDFKKIIENKDKAEKPVEPAKAAEVKQADLPGKDGLVGDNYAVPHDGEATRDDSVDENRGLLAREEGSNNKEFELKKAHKATSLDDVSKKVAELIGTCRAVLKREADHTDVEYLSRVIKEFEENVGSMVEKAKGMNMNEAWKAKAVQGRLSSYVKALKADFEFSDLFDGGIEKSVFELIGE